MNIVKKLSVFIFLLTALWVYVPTTAQATMSGSANNVVWGGQAEPIQDRAGIGNDDPRYIAANLINVVLGFLGIISVVLIIYAGFKWMTAAGNDEQVASAKKLLVWAVIGLVIILSAYALAAFVTDAIFRVTTDGS